MLGASTTWAKPTIGSLPKCEKFLRILVVEDEVKTAQALREGLEAEGFQVSTASTGEDAFFQVTTESFDLVVLDVMLPGRSGLDILDAVRKRGQMVPVLMLTARDSVEDRVKGLDTGADDYLVKPFAFAELVSRVRALMRRGRDGKALLLSVGDLHMDLVTRHVHRGSRVIELTDKEFELLEFLMRHPGQVVSRDMLAEVWNVPARITSLDNVIDVHIARLRKKIDHDFEVKILHTVRGAGFTLREMPV